MLIEETKVLHGKVDWLISVNMKLLNYAFGAILFLGFGGSIAQTSASVSSIVSQEQEESATDLTYCPSTRRYYYGDINLCPEHASAALGSTSQTATLQAIRQPTNPPEIQQQSNSSPIFVQFTKRVALVIGNGAYRSSPLRNPRNDADDISKALKSADFEVIDVRDATLVQMRNAVRLFGDKLLKNEVGLVYYSGHGVEVKGRNYFIPVNADIEREDEIADQGLDVSLILEKMSTAGKGVNILIVDACRDDPFGRSFRSGSKGLVTMDAPRGTIIAYATSPGRVAADGDGRNSPYTKALVKAMQVPNKPIELVFKEVRRAVQEETKNRQTPWENTSLSGDFFFKVSK